jgi:hypothetical protein
MRLGYFTMPLHPAHRAPALTLREEIGDVGELAYAGMDWVDPALAKRSMKLIATELMPSVNKAIGA